MVLAAAAGAPAAAQTLVFHDVNIVDGRGSLVQPGMDLTVADGRIVAIAPAPASGRSAVVKPGVQVIEGHGKYLMPGIIDAHVHLRGADLKAVLAGYLYHGVTTIADLGNAPATILPLREAERAGRIAAPRIFAAGNLVTAPGGKSAEMGLLVSDFARDRPLLAQHLATQQPDFAKLVYDEGGWPGTAPVALLPLSLLRQVDGFYKQQGLRTIVHVVNEQRAMEALDAGADALAHALIEAPVNDAFVRRMAASKTPFASTLAVGDMPERLTRHPEFLDQPAYAAVTSPQERETLRTTVRNSYLSGPRKAFADWRTRMLPVCMDNIRRIVQAGGMAALGTDQSNGAATHREMALLVQAGLTPAQVIPIATHNAAVFLGKAEELGAVEVGKRADLLLLHADPTQDVTHIAAIALVMKNGRIVDESLLPLAGGPQKARWAP